MPRGGHRGAGSYLPAAPWSVLVVMSAVCVNVVFGGTWTFRNIPHTLNHLVLNNDTGDLFVGATNRLYSISGTDLSVRQEVTTGPVLDSIECGYPFDACLGVTKVETSNVNKVLVVDNLHNQLITCGSVLQGTCEVRNVNNISLTTRYRDNEKLYVAANDDSSSTVAIIGKELDISSSNGNALYVGSTFTGTVSNLNYNTRSDVPAISSRNTHGNTFYYSFTDALDGVESGIKMPESVLSDMTKNYRIINYITGFSSGKFAYFLTTQLDASDETRYMSKIIQVCQNRNFVHHTYVEMPLQCTQGSTTYNLVESAVLVKPASDLAAELGINTQDEILIATFSKSTTVMDNVEESRESAICIYQVKHIREKFTENLQRCFDGTQKNRGGKLFGPNIMCQIITGVQIPEDFCGNAGDPVNSPLVGEVPVVSSPIIVLNDQSPPTSIAFDKVDGKHSVVLIGTMDGHLKKILLKSTTESRVFSDQVISEGNRILKDMIISLDRQYIYVMTQNEITKMPIQECGNQTSCGQCHGLVDPYCGWCSLENRCSISSQCPDYNSDLRWLTSDTNCISIQRVQPDKANIHIPINVTIFVDQLPPGHQYKCVYKSAGTDVVMDATVNQDFTQVTCTTPSDQSGLRIPQGKDHINVTLALRSVTTGVDFLSRPFVLYSCSERLFCGDCTVSPYPCQWCLHDNQCKDQSKSCTAIGSILTGNQDKCPVLEHPNEILLPSGVPQEKNVQGKNLPDDNTYSCHLFTADGSSPVYTFPATYRGSNTVACNGLKVEIRNGSKTINLILKVFWKNDIVVDGQVKLKVYSCGNIGSDCSSCLVEPLPVYDCGWCQNEGCVYKSQCSANVLESCPPADIKTVEPTTFPIDGGTLVTITGTNLGKKQSDIRSVTMVDVPCDIVDYETSQKIVCRTNPRSEGSDGVLTISYRHMNADAYLSYNFVYYKNPQLENIKPIQGPKSGGTLVTITGQELDTGKDIVVQLGSVACPLILKTDEELVCRSVLAANPDVGKQMQVRVTFDSAMRMVEGARYLVRNDPQITAISPTAVYESGGRIITIQGQHLDSVEKPQLKLVKTNYTSEGVACTKVGSTVLKCASPRITMNLTDSTRKRRQVDLKDKFTLQLEMDAVSCTKNISSCFSGISDEIHLYPDPVYESFLDGKKTFEGDTLTLNGENLNQACTKEEVEVMIGTEICKVDSLSGDKLLCTPPEEQPKSKDGNILPEVRVRVGNINKTLGRLEYAQPVNPEIYYIVVAVGGGILITIIIIVIVVYKRRSADVERQNKKLQIQLDTLESNVRNECKQAFAELQTEVSDFTSDLNVIGIPFWDYKMYTFRVLFPGLKDHPVLHNSNNSTMNKFGGYEQGLHQFNQLLNSKQFLLIFIRTLEQQKNFSIRDKSVVASLLMIVLQDKMEYATEILKSLLNELIDKSVEKKHPKLMLRRTESVVEKLLSNWLSLSMYTYLKKHAGKMLYMLFKAIKHQTEKGPIDVFTSEAKYSLSEDRLLRDKVEPKSLTLHVFMNDMKEPVTFKALDHDTITQAKEKALDAIYMNSPFSPRPSVYDVDLEWRSGKSGHLPLQDEDVTTQVIQGWKRVNSLIHYHVPDGATLVVVPSKSKNDLVRQKHGMIEISNSHSTLPPIVTMEEGTKVWHLVKHDDNQNVPRTQKVISEIFLTRLLATKGTLQQYIDDLFTTILRADNGLPPAVKYLFDFLDNAARRHNIVDPDVVHTWKSNSLPLRFWVNIIKNPEFIFDISKSNIVDSCLSVIAQTFMDSCSTAEHRLGKDSPSNKLLFAKDIPRFRGWVSKFYKSVGDLAPISDQDITRVMTEMSMTNFTDFNVSVALQDLYKYAMQYNFELLEALDDDPSAKRLHLANRFEQVQAVIEGTPLY